MTEERTNAISIPIISLTIQEADADSVLLRRSGDGEVVTERNDDETIDIEGVFVVLDGEAVFRPVTVGITGLEHFEVVYGPAVGDTVVSGPYQMVRQLLTGDPVRRLEENTLIGSAGG